MSVRMRQWTVAGLVAIVAATPAFGQGQAPRPGSWQTPQQTGGAATAQVRPAAPLGDPSMPVGVADGEPFRIGPEDVLDISVWKNTELTRTAVPVRPDGKISVLLLNDVQAAGLTPMQLRGELTKGYSTYFRDQFPPEISVIVREVHSIKVSVMGKVRTPGRFELKSQVSVLEALAMAGGFLEYAKENKVAVFRPDGRGWRTLPFNYEKVAADGDSREIFALQAGDVVVVR